MSITSQFLKKDIFIKEKNSYTAKDWAHAFLSKLDLIVWGLSKELIINQNPKFFNKV